MCAYEAMFHYDTFLLYLFSFFEIVSLCNSSWPGTHKVAQSQMCHNPWLPAPLSLWSDGITPVSCNACIMVFSDVSGILFCSYSLTLLSMFPPLLLLMSFVSRAKCFKFSVDIAVWICSHLAKCWVKKTEYICGCVLWAMGSCCYWHYSSCAAELS